MKMLKASELAELLNLSKARISQLVSEGRLDGAFQGDGRDRRFDAVKAAALLDRRLDAGQSLLGNGAESARARRRVLAGASRDDATRDDAACEDAARSWARDDGQGPQGVSDYERARTEKAVEEARRMRRLNAEADGRYVLADEVHRQVRRQMAQEIAEVTAFIRDASRAVADAVGADPRMIRGIMLDRWREHRTRRADAIDAAPQADLNPAEVAADI